MTTLAEKIAQNRAAAEVKSKEDTNNRNKKAWDAQFSQWKNSIILAANTATQKDFFTSFDCFEKIRYQTGIQIGVYDQVIYLSKFEQDANTKDAFNEFRKWLTSENLVCKFVVGEGYYYERDDKITTTEVYLVVSVKE